MKLQAPIDLGLVLLDHQLIDSDGVFCGKVDDIELRGEPGQELEVANLLVGPGTWFGRLPHFVEPLAKRVFMKRVVRVSLSAVEDVTGSVKLNRSARELGLGGGDFKLSRLFTWTGKR
jgi:hypothetical protein